MGRQTSDEAAIVTCHLVLVSLGLVPANASLAAQNFLVSAKHRLVFHVQYKMTTVRDRGQRKYIRLYLTLDFLRFL